MTNNAQQTLESIVEPICSAHGVELVQLRQLPGLVEVIIDRPRGDERGGSGVSVADCQAVSRDLSAALDVHEDVLPGNYRLEVSSPGLERPLVKLGDFDRFAGREVKIRTKHPIGDRKNLQGRLLGTTEGQVRLEMEGNELSISHDEIVKANLVHRF